MLESWRTLHISLFTQIVYKLERNLCDEGVNISQFLQNLFSVCVSKQNQLFPLGQGRRSCPEPQKQPVTTLWQHLIPFPSSEWDLMGIEIIFTEDMMSHINLDKNDRKNEGSWEMIGALNWVLVGNTPNLQGITGKHRGHITASNVWKADIQTSQCYCAMLR